MKGNAPLNASLDVGYDAFVEKRRDIGTIAEEGGASILVATGGEEYRQHGEASSLHSAEGALAKTEIVDKEAIEPKEVVHPPALNSEGVARRTGTTGAERRVLGDTLAPVLSSVPAGMVRSQQRSRAMLSAMLHVFFWGLFLRNSTVPLAMLSFLKG